MLSRRTRTLTSLTSTFIHLRPPLASHGIALSIVGADPTKVAAEILTSVADNKSDFVVAATFSARLALWLKFLAPSFLESQLMKRFEKGRLESKKDRWRFIDVRVLTLCDPNVFFAAAKRFVYGVIAVKVLSRILFEWQWRNKVETGYLESMSLQGIRCNKRIRQ